MSVTGGGEDRSIERIIEAARSGTLYGASLPERTLRALVGAAGALVGAVVGAAVGEAQAAITATTTRNARTKASLVLFVDILLLLQI